MDVVYFGPEILERDYLGIGRPSWDFGCPVLWWNGNPDPSRFIAVVTVQ